MYKTKTCLIALAFILAPFSTAHAADETALRTAAAHAGDKPVPSEAVEIAPAVEVFGEEVAYGDNDGALLTGYLARPVGGPDDLPGLIVIHEWWGLNDNIRKMAERLAGEGYVALAVDLYGGKAASTPKEAIGLMMGLEKNFIESSMAITSKLALS